MRRLIVLFSLLVLLASAPETVSRNIQIADPWVHETSEASALLHVTIANIDRRTDRLLRARASIAARVEIRDQNGHVGGFAIPGHAEYVIGDGFPRIVLLGLVENLRAQSSFDLLLVFERAGKVTVQVPINK
jgi:periplasmic copper chaperone A